MSNRPPSSYERVSNCLFCGGTRSESVFELAWNSVCHARFPDKRHREEVGQLHIRRCIDCGLEFQSPRPTEATLLSVVDRSYGLRTVGPKLQALFEKDLSLIGAFLPLGSSLLDVGCNIGGFLNMARQFYCVTGCDPIGRALEVGRRNFGLTDLYQGTLSQIPFKLVDAIVSLDTFEHLHDPKSFLQEANRRLRPGGMLYLRTLRRDGLNARLSGNYWYGYSAWHLFYPTISQVKDLCQENGFEPLQTVILRTEWPYFKESLSHHAKCLLATLFSFLPKLSHFRRSIRRGRRVFSFYRDEFALVCRQTRTKSS